MNKEAIAFLKLEKITEGKVEGYSKWDEIPLSAKTVLVGRPGKDPNSASPDIKIVGDDYISRNQAKVFYSADKCCFMICDSGSSNGTFLNGEMLEQNKSYQLKEYDLISLAKISGETRVDLRFKLSDRTLPSWMMKDMRQDIQKTGLHINFAAKKVFVNKKEAILTRTEFKVLEVLYNNKGKACGTDDIAWEVWGKEGANDELVAKYISLLRKKLESDPSKPEFIITIPGRQGCYLLDI